MARGDVWLRTLRFSRVWRLLPVRPTDPLPWQCHRSRGCGKRLAASLSRTQQFPQAIERGLRVARRQGVRVERAKLGDDRGLRRVGHDVER